MLILNPDERFLLDSTRTMILNGKEKEVDPMSLRNALDILIRAARERRQVSGKQASTRSTQSKMSLQDLMDI